LRHVDLAGVQPLAQFVGCQVHQFDLVGRRKRRIGHGFAHPNAGDLPHHIDETLQVLDVERGPDIDAGGEQLLHILPPLRMARSGRVRVGVFVHQEDFRFSRQSRVDVEFHQLTVAILDRTARQHLDVAQQRFGLWPPMRLDHPNGDIDAVKPTPIAGGQHFERLAHPRRHAEVDLQLAAPLPLGVGQQGVRVRAYGLDWAHHPPRCAIG